MDRGTVFFIGRVDEVKGKLSKITIFNEFLPGLHGLKVGEKIIILYWFHKRDNLKERNVLMVHPKGDPRNPMRGVFSTRSPSRPNPIGLTIVEIEEIKENTITVRGLDALPGSPIIDIKPAKENEIKKI